jgi:hypothetical protein
MDSKTTHISSRDHRHGPPARRAILGIVIGLYLLSLGGLVGTVIERMRFDYRRAPVLARYEALLRARNATLMTIERDVAQGLRPTSDPFLARAEAAGN